MRIVFCGSGWLPLIDVLADTIGQPVHRRAPSRSVRDAIANADVVLPSNGAVDAEAIAHASHLRLIQQPAAGYDGIDLDAARARGIPVCNAPGTNPQAMAEAALLLLLNVARRTNEATRAVRDGVIGVPVGVELAGRTIVVVGAGRSGERFARAVEGLGMVVRRVTSAHGRGGLLDALAGADALSIHCPLDATTHHLIDAEALARLNRGALLVNAARGAIVERAALEAALDGGRLRGAGLDVLWDEPWNPADPLLARDDVYVTPHLGGSTEASFARIAAVVAENIRRLSAEEPLLHRIV
ncbi:MAG: NAD(P)-dependent oxidoreductase [Deltaproteobacteria bacterium]